MVRPLERAIEAGLAAGLLMSALLLVVGLAGRSPAALRAGILLLMLTPVARVLILTVGLLLARDWLFGLVSLFVLTVLVSGMFMALRLSAPPDSPPPAATP